MADIDKPEDVAEPEDAAESEDIAELNSSTKPEDLAKLAENTRRQALHMEMTDPVLLVERVYKLWWNWADFTLFVVNPTIPIVSPPIVIGPEPIPDSSDMEFVYPIHDHGYKLTTSKSIDMFTAGSSMCKLYFTIEKMVQLLVERIQSSGVDDEMEVQVAFGGHELAQRKAFESIINLPYNVVVNNFEPGVWGERYLATIKRLADKGYGYPPESPRDVYRVSHSNNGPKKQ